ncbi:type II toxin-antitoxin system VapC family toxin [Candidatus Poriferisocius sp.]|uniref:type II toxin-antitoxin system VapC family toxin n=1 Tax=Candidatus Poriferisocius sp. TaxID=3101276 RepID=UPI003B01CCB1
MKLVDANVLLYAVNEDAPRHHEARAWLDGALSGGATVAFSWIVLLAFARLSTQANLFPSPLSLADALDQVEAWLSQPSAAIVEPTARHLVLVRELLVPFGGGGNLVNDAHLAALAIEHHSQIVSYDHDFSRFPDVRWETPA